MPFSHLKPVTKEQELQIEFHAALVKEQRRTNELLEKLIEAQHPPAQVPVTKPPTKKV